MSKSTNILVIDDEQVIIDAVVKICKLEDYSLDSALSIAEALEKISRNIYEIILCDIMMPDGDGFQILEEIQTRYNNTLVIMMTGYSTVENAVNSLYNGAVDFISKPFTVDELLSSIYRARRIKLLKEKRKQILSKTESIEICFVDCPTKYFRLGSSSWLVEERDGSVLVGVCDIFLKAVESVIEIDLLMPEDELIQGISCMTIKSENDRIHKVLSPISGRVIDLNEKLKINPKLIEKDPYFEGWVYRVIPADIEYELKKIVPCSSDRNNIGVA